MKRFIFSLTAAMTLACTPIEDAGRQERYIDIPVSFTREKSVYEAEQDMLGDVNLLVYDEDGALVEDCGGIEVSRHYDSWTELGSIRLIEGRMYSIYMLANCGDMKNLYPASESGLESFCCEFKSYIGFKERGFPLAYHQHLNTVGGCSIDIRFTRMVSRIDLMFDKTGLPAQFQAGTFVTHVGIRQAALNLFPFASGGSRATRCTSDSEGDYLSDEDVEKINSGEPVPIYVLTNMQGDDILPPECELKNKTPSYIKEHSIRKLSEEQMRLLTYIEMHCSVDSPDARYDKVVYRHYPGGDSAENYNYSFNIYPGHRRSLTLCLTSEMVDGDDWRIDPDDPAVKYDFDLDLTRISIIKGYDAYNRIEISSERKSMLERLEIEKLDKGDPFVSYCLSELQMAGGGTYRRTLTFYSGREVEGRIEADLNNMRSSYEPYRSTFRISCHDTHKDVEVLSFDRSIPIYIMHSPSNTAHFPSYSNLLVCSLKEAPSFDYSLSISGELSCKHLCFNYNGVGARSSIKYETLSSEPLQIYLSGTVTPSDMNSFDTGLDVDGLMNRTREKVERNLDRRGPITHVFDIDVNLISSALSSDAFHIANTTTAGMSLGDLNNYTIGYKAEDYLGSDHGTLNVDFGYCITEIPILSHSRAYGHFSNWFEIFDFDIYTGSHVRFSCNGGAGGRILPMDL